MSWVWTTAVTAAALALSACAGTERADEARAPSCLPERWAQVPASAADRAYDRAHDVPAMSGGSLSCTGYTTASRVRESLMQLQNALRARDVEALRAALLFPLRVNGCPGEMRDVAAADFAAQVETIFTPDTVAYVLSLKMADVWVLRNWRDPLEAGSGVGIGQGVMWWRNDDDGRTKVWGVNAGCRR